MKHGNLLKLVQKGESLQGIRRIRRWTAALQRLRSEEILQNKKIDGT